MYYLVVFSLHEVQLSGGAAWGLGRRGARVDCVACGMWEAGVWRARGWPIGLTVTRLSTAVDACDAAMGDLGRLFRSLLFSISSWISCCHPCAVETANTMINVSLSAITLKRNNPQHATAYRGTTWDRIFMLKRTERGQAGPGVLATAHTPMNTRLSRPRSRTHSHTTFSAQLRLLGAGHSRSIHGLVDPSNSGRS